MNCQGDHVAISRDCPKWKIEKDIVTLKYTEKISFADARKRLQPSSTHQRIHMQLLHRPLLNLEDLFHPWSEKSDFQLTLGPRLSI